MDILVEESVIMGTDAGGTTVIVNPIYEPRATFSINASNQLQGTLWIVKDGQRMASSIAGAAYEIFDKERTTTGISQSAMTADVNGLYKITATSAALINDLTHYTVKITINADSSDRVGYVGLVIGE
jgi:hypothetical protein